MDNFINETLGMDCINCLPIEDFSIKQLDELAEKAKKNNLMLTLKAEHSNVHQGVLVQMVKRDFAENLLRYL